MDLQRESRRLGLGLVALFLALAVAAAAGALFYYNSQELHIESESHRTLAAVADLKVQQVARWRGGLIETGRVIESALRGPGLRAELVAAGGPGELRGRLFEWLRDVTSVQNITDVSVVGQSGRIFFSLHEVEHFSADGVAAMRDLIGSGEPGMTDLHPGAGAKRIHVHVVIPMEAPAAPFTEPAAVVLRVEADRMLYPILESWPAPSTSAETYLVRRENASVLYLNELRHRKNTALRLRLPLRTPDLCAAQAAQGMEGICDGIDYRGERVVSAMRVVPGTAWGLMAEIDREEVYANLRERFWIAAAMATLMVAAMGALLALIWRNHAAAFYRARYSEELERRALAGHYGFLSRYANDIILLLDDAGRIVESNERAASAYGYAREELARMDIDQLRDPFEAEQVRQALAAATEGEGLLLETRHRRRDGSIFPVEVSVRAITVSGRAYRQEIIRDITERKLAEARIHASQEEMADAQRLARVGSWTWDLRRGWISGSEQAVVNLGEPNPTTFERVQERVHSDDREALRAATERCINAGEPVEIEFRVQWPPGEERVMRSRAEVERDENGRPVRLRGTLQDLTEMRRAEQALRESEQRLREVMDNVQLAAVTYGPAAEILSVNPHFLHLTGWSRDELLGRDFIELFVPEHLRESMRHLYRQTIAGEIWMPSYENEIVTRSGGLLTVSWKNATNRDASGQVVSITSFGEDLTERRRLEARLLQAQKLDSLARLAGGVAHDFNNLLTVINGYCELMLARISGGDPLRHQAEEIQRAGQRAELLTRQLLAFSRRQPLQPTAVDLNAIVTEGSELLRHLAGRDVEVALDLAPGLPPVLADSGQIHQVLMNLVMNARDAMPQGGRCRIETRDLRPAEDAVLVAVTDNGAGMEPATAARAFDPFFTTKGDGAGTGLGLSIVHGIISQSGGRIDLQTAPGQGSRFELVLPATPGGAVFPLDGDQRATLAAGGHEDILLVEDQAEVRGLVAGVLHSLGYHVLEAASAEEALGLLQNLAGPPDLLLTDVVMPGMDGCRLAAEFLRRHPGTPVLFMSGYQKGKLVEEREWPVPTGFLPKPFSPGDLAAKVREVLQRPV